MELKAEDNYIKPQQEYGTVEETDQITKESTPFNMVAKDKVLPGFRRSKESSFHQVAASQPGQGGAAR